MNVLSYINRTFHKDFTCWNFVCLYYRKELNVILNPYAVNGAVDIKGAIKATAGEVVKDHWKELETPIKYCVIVLGKKKAMYHAGIMLTDSKVIHLLDNSKKPIVSTLAELKAKYSTVRFYLHADLHPTKLTA